MPQHSFRLGLRFSLIGLAFSSAWGAILAADSETAIKARAFNIFPDLCIIV